MVARKQMVLWIVLIVPRALIEIGHAAETFVNLC